MEDIHQNLEQGPMDPDYFQRLMHEQNQQRLKGLEDSHKEMTAALARIEANTKDLPGLADRIESLESSRDKLKGAMVIGMALEPFVTLGLNRLMK